MTYRFTTSRYGNKTLQIGPYKYSQTSRSSGSKVRWYCTRNNKGCKAIAVSVDEELIGVYNEHIH